MLAETLSKVYSESGQEKIHVKLRHSEEKGSEEAYQAVCEGGVIRITAGNEKGLMFGAAQLGVASKARHVGEWLGRQEPGLTLRPLWLKAGALWRLNDQVGIALPHVFSPEIMAGQSLNKVVRRVVRRLVEMGYNSLIFGKKSGEELTEVTELPFTMEDLLSELRSTGVRVYVKPEIELPEAQLGACPLKPQTRAFLAMVMEDVLAVAGGVDGILWESLLNQPGYATDPVARDFLVYDLVLSELRLLEHLCARSRALLFYLPCRDRQQAEAQASWLPDLCDDADHRTVLLFSATAGAPEAWECGEHPLWLKLRELPDSSYTPLMPLVNAGSTGRGEGWWPSFPLGHLDSISSRLWRHRFAGALVMGNLLPQQGALLELPLWSMAQAQWRAQAPSLMAETWLRAFFRQERAEMALELFRVAEQVLDDLFRLRGETEGGDVDMLRRRIEGTLGRLKALEVEVPDGELKNWFTYFLRDARRLVHNCLQRLNIAMGSVLSGDDLHEAFWTEMDAEPSRGIGAGAQVRLRATVNRGAEGSKIRELVDKSVM